MDKQKLTMATLGGHGFGAKVALATAIDNMERCTGVINLDGGPLDHRYYDAYHELQSYVEVAAKMDTGSRDYASASKYVRDNIACKKWASIFQQNLEDKGGSVAWKLNIDALRANMRLRQPDVCAHRTRLARLRWRGRPVDRPLPEQRHFIQIQLLRISIYEN